MEDRALVAKIQQGDMNAFALLIKQHERLVAHMIAQVVKRDEEREELCQDVFMKVYANLNEFAFNSKLSTWIATIAYRHALNHLRKNKIQTTEIPNEESLSDYFVEAEATDEKFMNEDTNSYILKLVDLLPPQYKTVLLLFHVEHMNYPEIGEVTGMPEGTVKNYLFRARTLLKEKVKAQLTKEELL